MQIDKKEIERLAKLSNLEFSEKEKQQMLLELNKIIKFAQKIKEFECKKEEIIKRSVKISDLREDTVMPSLAINKILYNAPEKESNAFSVPKVVD